MGVRRGQFPKRSGLNGNQILFFGLRKKNALRAFQKLVRSLLHVSEHKTEKFSNLRRLSMEYLPFREMHLLFQASSGSATTATAVQRGLVTGHTGLICSAGFTDTKNVKVIGHGDPPSPDFRRPGGQAEYPQKGNVWSSMSTDESALETPRSQRCQ